MYAMTRRASLLAASAAIALGVAACATGGAAPSAATIIADLQGGFAALATQLPALTAADASLGEAIAPYVTQATALLTNLTAASAGMSGTLATIDGIINSILSTAAASGLVPAPFDLLVEGLSILAPELEALINPLLTPATAAARMPYPHPHVVSIAQARALFAAYR